MAQSPQEVAKRWSTNLAGASDKISAGVRAVATSPTARAAQQKAKYVAGVQAKADKWAARLNAVSLADWQNSMIQRGIPRIASGAAASEGKMASFLSQLLPYVEANVGAIRAMPSLTLEDSVNRAAAWIRTMSKFSYRK